MTDVPLIAGLSEVIDAYDALILDLWGVVHDGVRLYPQVPETLARLRDAGRHTLLLSNAPRRAYALVEAMTGMGLDRGLYGAVMSSGEAVHRALLARDDPFFAALGRRCLHIGPERDRNIFEGLDLSLAADPAAADFVLNTGPWSLEETVADYEVQLRACAAAGLPMVCANPDLVVIREGRAVICAGALARRYEELGGRVAYRGKPDPAIYDDCMALLEGVDRRRVLAVGDAFHTDIAGAANAGIDAVLVTSGIHAEEMGVGAWGEPPAPERLRAAVARHGQRPLAAIPALRW